MKKSLTASFITLVVIFTSGRVTAQNKIGYISIQELISIMPETRKADSSLQQYRTALIQNAQDKQSSLEGAIEKFNKDSSSMSSTVKQAKRIDLQKMLSDQQQEEPRMQQQLQEKQQELIEPIRKKALDAIQAVAKENGYSHIFDRRALVVERPGDDVINLVAKKLNVKMPATQQRPAAQGR